MKYLQSLAREIGFYIYRIIKINEYCIRKDEFQNMINFQTITKYEFQGYIFVLGLSSTHLEMLVVILSYSLVYIYSNYIHLYSNYIYKIHIQSRLAADTQQGWVPRYQSRDRARVFLQWNLLIQQNSFQDTVRSLQDTATTLLFLYIFLFLSICLSFLLALTSSSIPPLLSFTSTPIPPWKPPSRRLQPHPPSFFPLSRIVSQDGPLYVQTVNACTK